MATDYESEVVSKPASPRASALFSPAERWFGSIPDNALYSLIVFFGMFTLLLGLSERLLQDPDTYQQIATAKSFFYNGSLPHTDDFSYTFAGSPWVVKEWLSLVILYGAYSFAGWSGVAILTALILAGSFAVLFAWLLRRVKPTVALGLILILISLSAADFSARPKIFFIALLMMWMAGLMSARERGAAPGLWMLGLLVLWANLHASFTIVLPLTVIVGLEALVSAPAGERGRTLIRWAGFGLGSLVVVGATPYGYQPLIISLTMMGGNEGMEYITEWQPLRVSFESALPLAVLAAGLAVLAVSPRQNLFRLILILFCAVLMFQHQRFISLFAIVALMVMVSPLVHQFPGVRPRVMPLDTQPARMESVGVGTSRGLAGGRRFAILGLTVLVGSSLTLATLLRPSPGALITPSAALAAARQSGATGHVFNEYDFGGYLIFEGVKTFIDGRSDQLFSGGFMKALNDAKKSKSPDAFTALLNRYDVTWALVRPRSPEATKLDQAKGWSSLYQDKIAVVYLKQITSDNQSEPGKGLR